MGFVTAVLSAQTVMELTAMTTRLPRMLGGSQMKFDLGGKAEWELEPKWHDICAVAPSIHLVDYCIVTPTC